MARVIILSFNDNAVAESFARNMITWQEDGYDEVTAQAIATGLSLMALSGAEIESIVARPTLGCQCVSGVDYTGKKTFARTTLFRWYVHTACGRPEQVIVDRFIENLTVSGGANLLPALHTKWRKKERQGNE